MGVKNPKQIRDDMRKNNADLARNNLRYDEDLDKLRKEVMELKETARKKREELDGLAILQAKALEQYQPTKLLSRLETLADEIDDESENIAQQFQDGELPLSDF